MARALVIGGQGVLGTFIARAFSDAGWDVVRAGRREEEADDFRLLDIADGTAVTSAVAEADVVLNTAHHPGLAPELAALREGSILLDSSELKGKERSSLAGEPAPRGLVAADAGLSGIAYLAIADLLRKHPDADEAHYMLMFSAVGSAGRTGTKLGHTLLADTAHHPSRKVHLPKPWKTLRCLEVGTGTAREELPNSIGQTPMRQYLSIQPRVLQSALVALNAARAISLLPSAVFTAGTGKVPDEPSDEPVCEWVAVSKNGKTLAARTVQGRGYYRMTAAAILTFAEALSKSGDTKHGFFSVADLITLDPIADSLERHGISVCDQPTSA